MTSEEKAKELKRKNNSLYYMRHKEYVKEYQRKNREHIRELQSQWRAKNRERIRATARAKYAETHKRVKRSRYDGETFLGKRVGMFLKKDAERSYRWLKEHFKRQRERLNEESTEHTPSQSTT